ncbi:MAG: lantibiotic dehydratase [Bacteroidota bacterium]
MQFSFFSPLICRVTGSSLQTLNGENVSQKLHSAIYLASFNLFRQHLARIANGQPVGKSLQHALTRYHVRMTTRSTPFGFFAGCGITRWCDTVQVNTQQAWYHTRLDHLVLHQLAEQILQVPAIQAHLRYFPNSSIYSIDDEIRYVEYTLTNQKRDYKLSAVAASDNLESVLHFCQSGAKRSELDNYLVVVLEVSPEEANLLSQELIENQLLVSELEPAITGEEYLPRLIRWVAALEDTHVKGKSSAVNYVQNNAEKIEISVTEVLALLQDIDRRLKAIKNGTTTVMEQGPQIVNLLRPWLSELTENKLFQVDTIFPSTTADSNTAENHLTTQLSEVISVLNKLTLPTPSPSLTRFAQQFRNRFDDQEIPLAEALDSEVGIDYLQNVPTTLSPLVENLDLPATDREQSVTWDKLQQWRWNLLQDALFEGQAAVELTDEMLRAFSAPEDGLPPSMSVMFRRVENGQLYLDSVGGVSATNLINRFAHADPSIHRIVQDICDQEQQHNPEVIFAEIVHLPESRTGNIMFHPTSRAYEIPYLANSSIDKTHQIPLSDLRVSVRGSRVVLRSRRLNKEIIPRLSIAHNYLLSELAVYRFLCDLQGQGLRSSLSFSWGALAARHKFLPRVTYKNVILYPATWRLRAEDFAILKQAKTTADFWQAFQSFCTHWRLPQYWVLSEGDNELFVDSEQPQIVEAWWDLAKKRKQLTIKEFFFPAEGAVVNESGEAHAHQLVATWIKQTVTYRGTAVPSPEVSSKITRSFSPGSEWLYYKLYGGVSSADRVLEEAIAPLVEQLQQDNKIDQWFFIRYADPETHLRVRLLLSNVAYLGEVIKFVGKALAPFEPSNLLSKIQLDTYQRELERYGGEAIMEAEALFYHDSEAILKFLSLTEGDGREDLRWLWGLRSIDTLLDDFGLETSQKLTLLQRMKDSFAREYRMNKPLKLQLDKKYRAHRKVIHRILTLDNPDDEWYPLIEVLKERSAQQLATVTTLHSIKKSDEFTELLRSYIHMLVNRLIPSGARFHEMVLYNFLYREYRSTLARQDSHSTVQ